MGVRVGGGQLEGIESITGLLYMSVECGKVISESIALVGMHH